MRFADKAKAINYKDNLKNTLKKFNWQVISLNENVLNFKAVACYKETELEKSGLDILKFFSETVNTICQLRDYAKNMDCLEKEYNKKILDVRHYIRDRKTKLNAIQMQRIGYFLQQLERERYECKSNRLIAETFLVDFKRLENIKYIDTIKSIKESEYKPEILTYELLDDIVGRKQK